MLDRRNVLLRTIALFASVAFPVAAHSQQLEKVTYLLPAPPTLPAFSPWVIAQQRGPRSVKGEH
jgi:NitT/TauT family transport system substrate-binding protein